MWKAFYAGMSTQLPLLAMFVFVSFFVVVLVWLAWRGSRSFEHAAALPLADDTHPQPKEHAR